MKNECLECVYKNSNNPNPCRMVLSNGNISYPFPIMEIAMKMKNYLKKEYEGLSRKEAFIKLIKNKTKTTRHCYLSYSRDIYEEIKNFDLAFTYYDIETSMKGINEVLYMTFGNPNDNNNALRKVADENLKYWEEEQDTEFIIDLQSDLENISGKTQREVIIKARVGHGRFKDKLLKLHGKCQISGINNMELLVASHIKPWSISTDQERLNVYNGLLLCTQYDSLFDKGFISFENNGKIMISSLLDVDVCKNYNVKENIKIKLHEKNKHFLEYHREKLFLK